MTASSPASRWTWIGVTLIGCGMLVSGLLLARTWVLTIEPGARAFDVCAWIVPGADCSALLQGGSWWVLGVPVAGWALVYFVALATFFALALALGEPFEPVATLGLLIMVEVGAWLHVGLAALALAGRAPLCRPCLLVLAVNLALVPVMRRRSAYGRRELTTALVAGWRYLCGADPRDPVAARWRTVGLLVVALAALVTYQWVAAESRVRRVLAETDSPSRVLAAFDATPRREIAIAPEDPRLGPAEARFQLVVFGSFQCPGCQTLARDLRGLTRRHADDLAVVFKHFPLGAACNPAVGIDLQPQACAAAQAAEAARLQGKFLPFHDALLASDLRAEEATLLALALEVGVDPERFRTDRAARTTHDRIAADVAQGIDLGIDGTPAVFVNGRRVANVSRRRLEILLSADPRE